MVVMDFRVLENFSTLTLLITTPFDKSFSFLEP